jgi:hypothetical protein
MLIVNNGYLKKGDNKAIFCRLDGSQLATLAKLDFPDSRPNVTLNYKADSTGRAHPKPVGFSRRWSRRVEDEECIGH